MLLLAALCFVSLFEGYQQQCRFLGGPQVDIKKLAGEWWEFQTYNTQHLMVPNDHDCMVSKFYPTDHSLKIIEDFIVRSPGNKEHTRREWKMEPINKGGSSITYWAGILSSWGTHKAYQYYIIKTDYENLLISAICSDMNFHGVYVMTKKQILSDDERAKLGNKVRDIIASEYQEISDRDRYTTKNNNECAPVNFPKNP